MLEVDSKAAVQTINSPKEYPCSQEAIAQVIRELLDHCWEFNMQHIYSEANASDHCLTNAAFEQDIGILVHDQPMPCVHA